MQSRAIRCPSRYEDGSVGGNAGSKNSLPSKIQYFEFLDFVMSAITDRFTQEGFEVLVKIEQILVRKASDEDVDQCYLFDIAWRSEPQSLEDRASNSSGNF